MRHVGLPLVLLAIAPGCANYDPFLREGAWRPSGVNERNLVTMVAVPEELQRGVGTDHAGGELAAAAVERLLTDRLRELPQTSPTVVVGSPQAGTP